MWLFYFFFLLIISLESFNNDIINKKEVSPLLKLFNLIEALLIPYKIIYLFFLEVKAIHYENELKFTSHYPYDDIPREHFMEELKEKILEIDDDIYYLLMPWWFK